VGEQYVRAHDHQYYPLQLLLARLPASRTACRPALFPAAFNFQYTSHEQTEWVGLIESGFRRVYAPTTLFELVLHVTVEADDVALTIDYCTDLFSRETITTLAGEYTRTLRALCRDEVPFNRAAKQVPELEGQRVNG
jgi:non-ribosomal peptide synthetase component F